jgi:hypothetical protein
MEQRGPAMRRILVLVLLVVGAVITIWRLTCPALVRLRFGVMPGSAHLLILNPIRTGAANRSSIALLELLRSGDIADLSRRFPLLDKALAEENLLPPLRSWVLDDVVVDPGGGLDFEYLYSSTSNSKMGGYIWIYCVKGNDGAWTVKRFNRVD